MLASAGDMTDEKGFTLIELVVSVVIVGALSAVTMVSVGGITHRGKAAACNADIRTVSVAADAFLLSSPEGRPAPSLHELVTAGLLAADPGDVTYTPSVKSFTAVGKIGCT